MPEGNYIDSLAARVRAALPEGLLPDEDRLDDLFRVYALLILVRARDITGEDVHNAWATWMALKGEQHDSIRPFADLDEATRREDDPFVAVLRTLA